MDIKPKYNLIALVLTFLGFSLIASADNVLPTPVQPTIGTNNMSVLDYGASTTSVDNATAIQNAINACSHAGGGVVTVPEGEFLSGPVFLMNNVNLLLEKGCTIKALPYGQYPTLDDGSHLALINGGGTHDLMVSGEGTLNGNGAEWWAAYNADKNVKRFNIMTFNGCQRIRIEGVRLLNSPNVHISLGRKCDNTTIDGITTDSPEDSPNTDGIAIWCPNVEILNCTLKGGDDNIAIDDGSYNIWVHDCTILSGHGTCVGSYTSRIHDVTVERCTYTGTQNGARLKSNASRGGGEYNFVFSDLTMTDVENPIVINSWYGSKLPKAEDVKAAPETWTTTTPAFRNITFRNITSKDQRLRKSTIGGFPILIYGRPEQQIKNVTFDNVVMEAYKGCRINFVDSLRFINGCSLSIREETNRYKGDEQTIIEGVDANFVDTLLSLKMPASTQSVSGEGSFPNGFSYAYDHMTYKSDNSQQKGETVYQFSGNSKFNISGPFDTDMIISARVFTYKDYKTLDVYTDSALTNKIASSASMRRDTVYNVYIQLTNLPEGTRQLYFGGSYVFVNELAIIGNAEQAATGIEHLHRDELRAKNSREGVFDLQGQRHSRAILTNGSKGLYIVDGRKILVK